MRKYSILIVVVLLVACQPAPKDNVTLVKEIEAAEAAFNDLAAEKGVKEAFLTYVAEDGVINRNGRIIKGKTDIEAYFDASTLLDVSLQWKPEFVDVSASGDMAYTYGPYTFSAKDTTGQAIESQGLFHTVWKRQADGSWKFVYD